MTLLAGLIGSQMKFNKLNLHKRGLSIWDELPENKNKEFEIGS